MLNIFVLEDEIDSYPREQIKTALKGHKLTIARSAPDAEKIYKGGYDLLLLDHDMEGFYEYREGYFNTGLAFLKWLLKNFYHGNPNLPQVILHSQNAIGRNNMRLLLKDYGHTNVDEYPFGPEYVKLLKGIK